MTSATLVLMLMSLLILTPLARPAATGIPTPCDLPGVDVVCDAAGHAIGSAAQDAGEYVMKGVTTWVTDTAVWVTGKVGDLISATTSPNVEADWFTGQYQSMITVAGALALPMLLLAVIQAVWRQDIWILLRSAFGYLPIAFILAVAAIVATQLLVGVTDDLSGIVVNSLGGNDASNLLQSVGNAYTQALSDNSSNAVPLFGIFLGAIILAIGAFVLWLELIIRDAAIYVALFFLPLTFVAMIWPATSRWARRLVEFLVAIVLAKFVIVAIISLATAAITNTTLAGVDTGSGGGFERMIAGSALLVLAAWSPFALLRLIPMMEVAAASVTSQRSSMGDAAGSAGIQSPASYMRQAMDRHSHSSPPTPSTGQPRVVYGAGSNGFAETSGGRGPAAGKPGESQHESSSSGPATTTGTATAVSRSGQASRGQAGQPSDAPLASGGAVPDSVQGSRPPRTADQSETVPRPSPPHPSEAMRTNVSTPNEPHSEGQQRSSNRPPAMPPDRPTDSDA